MAVESNRQLWQARRWIEARIPTVVAGLIFLLLWEGTARLIDDNRKFATIAYTRKQLMAERGDIFVQITETFTSVIVAFLLAAILGVLLGVVIAEVYTLRQMTMPLIIFAYAVPHPILAPMFIIWFLGWGDVTLLSFPDPGYWIGETLSLSWYDGVAAEDAQQSFAINGVTTFGAWVGFFPVFISTITGMNELEERFEHLGTVLGATRWQMVKYFRFWRALPNIASSIKSTVQLSIVGVIVAEFLASSSGIGYEIVLAWKRNQLGKMFGVVLIIMIGSYLFFQFTVWLLKVLTPPGSVD